MRRIKAHFDGKVIVPDEPVDLPADTRLNVQFECEEQSDRDWMTGKEFLALVEQLDFPEEDLDEMERAIEEACERIDHDGW